MVTEQRTQLHARHRRHEMTPHQLQQSTTVLAPSGELDLAAVDELRSRLLPAVRPGAAVVLDLQDVIFLDSSALSLVVVAERRLRATGGSLQLVHVVPEVLRVLRICGLADRLVLRPDRTPGTALPAGWLVLTGEQA